MDGSQLKGWRLLLRRTYIGKDQEKLCRWQLARRWALAGLAAGLLDTAYCMDLAAMQDVADFYSARINTFEDLKTHATRERDILGVRAQDARIRGVLSRNLASVSHMAKERDGLYELVLSPRGRTTATIQHEVYHLAAGHLERPPEEGFLRRLTDHIKYKYWEEPCATAYSLARTYMELQEREQRAPRPRHALSERQPR